MPEVISLVSSSPPRSFATEATGRADVLNIVDFGSDDFDVTGDLDFSVDRSAKRRKLSPGNENPAPASQKVLRSNTVFDLSSEPDLHSSPPKSLPVHRAPNVTEHDLEADDDFNISFSSSAPEPRQVTTTKRSLVFELSSDDGLLSRNTIEVSSPPTARTGLAFSERTSSLLANIGSRANRVDSESIRSKLDRAARAASVDDSRSKKFRKAAKTPLTDNIESSQPEPNISPVKKAIRPRETVHEEDSVSQNVSKATKTIDKEAEKERKRREKQEKLQEKQRASELAEANKSKTNKKNSTSEMVIRMPGSLKGKSIANQTEEFMKELDVDVVYGDDEEADLTDNANVSYGKIIRWRRRVTAEYDEHNELWTPLARPRITNEDHILIYITAEELATLAIVGEATHIEDTSQILESTMKSNLDDYMSFLRQRHPGCRPIFLIEGLTAWLKRSHTAKNRAYTAAVRSQVLPHTTTTLSSDDESSPQPPPPPSSTQPASTKLKTNPPRRTTKKQKSTPSTLQIDFTPLTTNPTTPTRLLLHLQLTHPPLQIHHTTSAATSAHQLRSLTQHLSTRPYRLAAQSANLSSASFCMTTGQIRTGSTAGEVWVNMLQEINRVTPSMAYGICAAGFRGPVELIKGFKKRDGEREKGDGQGGKMMLQDVRKAVNRDGGWSDRRLGPMVSKRVYKVFLGTDPGVRDGIA